MKTIFCDLDGTILEHMGSLSQITLSQKVLPGVIKKFDEWTSKSYTIIITTARPESLRELTEQQLKMHGLHFHDMIMNLPTGPRYVLNDTKSDGTIRAVAIPLNKDDGLENIEI